MVLTDFIKKTLDKKTEIKPPVLDVRSNPQVRKNCAKLWKNRDATGDIKFKVEGVEISAHKCILATLSPKFERQFYGEFDDKDKQIINVNEEGVTAAAFKEFLQFFYLDEVHLRHENIEGVLFLAKESLVEEFYDECVKYLREALSTENVCLSFDLALLHECEELKNDCENLIRSKTMEVFAADGFMNCSRSTLSEILQLTAAKATDVFEIWFIWAKQYCAQNGMNSESNEHLRAAIGDVLYRIDFGKMTIEEFMRYYTQHKSLFTDEERDEILKMIGKVNNFKPKFFVGSTKLLSSNSSVEVKTQTMRKWDGKASVYCHFIRSFLQPVSGSVKTLHLSFSCNREVILGGFFCRTVSVTTKINVKISDNNEVVHIESKKLNFHHDQQSYFELNSPILIKPEKKYNISMSIDIGFWRFEIVKNGIVTLNNNTVVRIHHEPTYSFTAITALSLNL